MLYVTVILLNRKLQYWCYVTVNSCLLGIFYILYIFLYFCLSLFLLYTVIIRGDVIFRSLHKNKWIYPTLTSMKGKRAAILVHLLFLFTCPRASLPCWITWKYHNVFVNLTKSIINSELRSLRVFLLTKK